MSETKSYFRSRLDEYGITDEDNLIHLWQSAGVGENELKPFPVFSEDPLGIFIRVYTLGRSVVNYAKQGSRWKTNTYGILRYEEPKITSKGDTLKYLLPKGQPVLPFFPPGLVTKYDNKETIKTLYITEGYFKAFKAQMHGIDCIGLASITCMRDKQGRLHEDIRTLIIECKVENVVWLVDGDCRNITTKDISEGVDLANRPNQFFKTVQTFHDAMSEFEDRNKYFAHINTENLSKESKGLDDLLIDYAENMNDIIKELNTFSLEQGTYSVKFNISYGLAKIRRYFMLGDIEQFYLYHVEKRPELSKKPFKFYGSIYRYDDNECKCIIVIPGAAANYFRVGDKYYKYIGIPNKYENINRQYQRSEASTIKDDHGKEIFKHIPKYEAFCVVPDHMNYQRVISSCFNLYHPFVWEAEEGEFDTIISFLKHIFGTEPIKINDELTVERWELGLDYIQLLYKVPQQILPILCLVSKERQTGKSTFLDFLHMIFSENMAIVGNDDLGAQFNAHWSSKLIVACDETKIDKHIVMEKVKALSTASNIMMNAKGKDQVSMEFFAKFILCSNNEDNFATIDREEIRFWVIKVPPLPESNNVGLLVEMREEVPAFIHYLNSRKMITEHVERHWFETRLIRTEALGKVQSNSRSAMEKNLIDGITELFEASDYDSITIPLRVIAEEILKKSNDKDYISRILRNLGYTLHTPQRRVYPRIVERSDQEGNRIQSVEMIGFQGRYYEFKRSEFIKDHPLDKALL